MLAPELPLQSDGLVVGRRQQTSASAHAPGGGRPAVGRIALRRRLAATLPGHRRQIAIRLDGEKPITSARPVNLRRSSATPPRRWAKKIGKDLSAEPQRLDRRGAETTARSQEPASAGARITSQKRHQAPVSSLCPAVQRLQRRSSTAAAPPLAQTPRSSVREACSAPELSLLPVPADGRRRQTIRSRDPEQTQARQPDRWNSRVASGHDRRAMVTRHEVPACRFRLDLPIHRRALPEGLRASMREQKRPAPLTKPRTFGSLALRRLARRSSIRGPETAAARQHLSNSATASANNIRQRPDVIALTRAPPRSPADSPNRLPCCAQRHPKRTQRRFCRVLLHAGRSEVRHPQPSGNLDLLLLPRHQRMTFSGEVRGCTMPVWLRRQQGGGRQGEGMRRRVRGPRPAGVA